MGGHTKMEDLPSSVTDHEPGVQQAESNGGDNDEVHGRDVVLVIAKKGLPALALVVVRVSLWKISRDSGKAHGELQLLEFGLDLSGTPTVLARESTNESLQLGWNRWSARTPLRDGSPVQPEALAMPADYGVGLDDDQGLFPARPEPGQKDPENPIRRSDPWLGPSLGVGRKLLTQGEFDDRLLRSTSKEGEETAREDRPEVDPCPQGEGHSARSRCAIRD